MTWSRSASPLTTDTLILLRIFRQQGEPRVVVTIDGERIPFPSLDAAFAYIDRYCQSYPMPDDGYDTSYADGADR